MKTKPKKKLSEQLYTMDSWSGDWIRRIGDTKSAARILAIGEDGVVVAGKNDFTTITWDALSLMCERAHAHTGPWLPCYN